MSDSERESAVATLLSRGRREKNQTVDAADCEVINDKAPGRMSRSLGGYQENKGVDTKTRNVVPKR
jgi:hypothetical protein